MLPERVNPQTADFLLLFESERMCWVSVPGRAGPQTGSLVAVETPQGETNVPGSVPDDDGDLS